jgi:hypothetical protein
VVATAVQGTIVTLFWLYVRSQATQITDAKAREDEWKRVALRGANEIIPSLAMEVRTQVRDPSHQLGEPDPR